MLPEAIVASYRRYKAYDSTILHWIVSTSNRLGYGKSSSPKTSKRAKHAKSGSKGMLEADDSKKPTKYIISQNEIVDRAEFIAGGKKHKTNVPTYVTNYLKKSIANREKCTAWFQKHKVGDMLVERSTADHVHFTGLLKKVLTLLEVDPPKALPVHSVTPSHVVADMKDIAGAKRRFSGLHVEDPHDIAELLEPAQESPDPTLETSEYPPTQVKDVYQVASTEEDRLIAAYDLLEKLKRIRNHVKETWAEYRERRISLINVTAVTNAAIEFAHNWEDEFRYEFPESPPWDELVDLLFPDIVNYWQKEPGAWLEQHVEELESIYYLTTRLLKDFRDTYHNPDWMQIWQPKVNRVYDPREDVSRLTVTQKLIRTKTIMDNVLPELALQAQHEIICTRDKVTGAFRHMLETSHVHIYVSFAFQILCDIHLVLGNQISRPFDDLQLQINRLFDANEDYIQPLSEAHKSYEEFARLHQMTKDCVEAFTGEDIMLRWRRSYFQDQDGYEYEAEAQRPYLLVTHQPLMCGSMTARTCFRMQEQSISIADFSYYVTAALHLHNALKQEQCLSKPISFLEALENLYESEKVFLGKPPTNPQAYRNHYLITLGFSLKYFAAGKHRKGSTRRKDEKSRPRDLTVLRPAMQALKNEVCWSLDDPAPPLSDLIKLVKEKTASGRPTPSKAAQRDKTFDPLEFLTSLKNCIKEEQSRLNADYYMVHRICFQLLQRLEASKLIHKKFRKEYDFEDEQLLSKLYLIPLFIFDRHLEEPKGMWMKSVGETVEKFFQGLDLRVEDLVRDNGDSTGEVGMDTAMGVGEGYGRRYKIDEKWHPMKDGRCYHVGVCELMVREWRVRAGLEVSELDEVDEDEEGEEGSEVGSME
ncbi:MAG: hypothetical protein Q9225_003062 [Loekoesia sp. 1 TL-2023]